MDESTLSKNSVAQLKEMLRANGLPVSGNKSALIGRLMESKGKDEVWDELSDLGEPVLKGIWPTTGYTFEHSRGRHDDEHFLGLGLDEENESELHEDRIKKWTAQVLKEFGLC